MQLNHKFRLVPFSENEQVQNVVLAKQNLSNILDDPNKSETEKAALFGDLLRRLRNYVEEINKPPLVRVDQPTPVSTVIKNLRISSKKKSKLRSRMSDDTLIPPQTPIVSKRRRIEVEDTPRTALEPEDFSTPPEMLFNEMTPMRKSIIEPRMSYAQVASPKSEAKQGRVVMIEPPTENAEPIEETSESPKKRDRIRKRKSHSEEPVSFRRSQRDRRPPVHYNPMTGKGLAKFRVQLWRI